MAASDNTTYMGIALVGGASEQVQIGDNGIIHQTLTNPGADNCFHMAIAEGTTVTSGYCQGVYVALTTATTAAWSTGNAQINAIAVDMFLGGSVGVETAGAYVYVAASSTPTVSSAWISGFTAYIADMGSSPSSMTGFLVHWDSSNAAASREAAFYCKGENGNSPNALLGVGNELPTYFLDSDIGGAGGMLIGPGTFDATATYCLACWIAGATFYIPLMPASA